MPELGLYWTDATSISQVPAQFWHITYFGYFGWRFLNVVQKAVTE